MHRFGMQQILNTTGFESSFVANKILQQQL